jgi:hypothetical protein
VAFLFVKYEDGMKNRTAELFVFSNSCKGSRLLFALANK